MNLQQVSGDVILAAKERITELQNFIVQDEASIQAALNAFHERQERGLRQFMTQAEFLTLFPEPPTTKETAAVNAKKAEIDEFKTIQETSPDLDEQRRAKYNIHWLSRQLSELKAALDIKLNGYLAAKENPRRPLTPEEFDQLYQGPTEADFADTRAKISAATAEANQLHLFLQSNEGQASGVYDLDLLDGTALEEPQP